MLYIAIGGGLVRQSATYFCHIHEEDSMSGDLEEDEG